MAVLTKQNQAQYELTATFEWSHDDTMLNISDVSKDFGVSNTGAAYGVFDVIKLPPNSVVTGGFLRIKEAFDTAGYDVLLGDSVDTDRYIEAADLKALGTTALLTTGYINTGGLSIRLTLGNDDVCTTGEGMLVVKYIIDGRTQENI
jgi:hypothetical protein